MTNETILTPAQVDSLLEGVLRASGSSLSNYTMRMGVEQMRGAIRAIEQAVLQSKQARALRNDAERYRWLRDETTDVDGNINDEIYVAVDSPAWAGQWALTGDCLDHAIDAAIMEQK